MPDQLETLFAEMRAGTITQVRPPGAAAARKTVKRRRVVSAAAGVTAVAAVAGGVLLAGPVTRTTVPAQRAPVSTGPEAQAWQLLAGLIPKTAISSSTGALNGSRNVPLDTNGKARYSLLVACAGEETIPVEVRLKSETLGGTVVECSGQPSPTTLTFAVPGPGPLTVRLGDDGTRGYYAAALLPEIVTPESPGAVTDAPLASEDSGFNAQRAADLLVASGSDYRTTIAVTTESSQTIAVGTYPAGEYRFYYACAGPGSVSFTITTLPVGGGVPIVDDDSLECTDEGTLRQGVPTVLDKESRLSITGTADDTGFNHAGWAYAVPKS